MPGLHVVSPVIESQRLSKLFGSKVLLKLDNVQPGGSFKIRGIGLLAQRAKDAGKTDLISSSGGNAGMAVAHAGKALGMNVIVVVPESTPMYMRELIQGLNATVRVHGSAWDEADKLARELASEPHAQYMPPFEDPVIWEGHASMMQELVDEKQVSTPPAAVVLSVGGGGLLCGVAEGLHKIGWDNVPIISAETKGASSFAQAVAANEPVTLESIDSVAKSLGAKRVGDGCLSWEKKHKIVPLVVSDLEAVEACLDFADSHRMLVEPACGASLAIAGRREELKEKLSITDEELEQKGLLIVVCGGNMANFTSLTEMATALKTPA